MRKLSAKGKATQQAIRDAAIALISEHGFEAVNMRELAARCGMQAGSLYNHFSSKQELLQQILEGVMQDLLEEFDEQVRTLDDPVDQMRAFVKLHVMFHTRRRLEVLLGNTELRSLTPENHERITALRDRYENELRRIIEKGVVAKAFNVPDVKMASFAIIAALTGVGHWYRPTGSIGQRRLVEIHERLVLQMLGLDGTASEAAPPKGANKVGSTKRKSSTLEPA